MHCKGSNAPKESLDSIESRTIGPRNHIAQAKFYHDERTATCKPWESGFHKVLVLDCESGALHILTRRNFNRGKRRQRENCASKLTEPVDRQSNSAQYRLLLDNIPSNVSRVPVFVDSNHRISINDCSYGQMWMQIRLDRLGMIDAWSRRMGGRRELYVQNEKQLQQ